MNKMDKNLINDMVNYIIEEGTQQTTEGNYIFYDRDFKDKFNITNEFLYRNIEDIVRLLERKEEISNIQYETIKELVIYIDVSFYLDYCPNVEIWEEEED